MEIPNERLPEGFAETVDRIPEHPAPARPAATVVLARNADAGMEVLLVRRNRSSGFVPGAWVFPGGRVDEADGQDALAERTEGLTRAAAADRLGLEEADPSLALAYYLAAIREAFEETGLLVGRTADGDAPPAAADHGLVDAARAELLDDQLPFQDALDRLGCTVAGDAIEYIAHWITPLVEPRRYDTRFFLAEVPAGSEAVIDPREMSAAQWLTPTQALERHRGGDLPMIFPTIRTLEALEGFEEVEEARAHFAGNRIPSILPRLVRTQTGVMLEVAEEVE